MTRNSYPRFGESPVLLLVTSLAASLLYLVLRWLAISIDALVISAMLIGIALGLRYRVHVVLLTSAIFASATVIIRSVHESPHAYVIGLNVLAVNIAHQIGYLFGLTSTSFPSIARTGKRAFLARAWGRDTSIRDQGDESEPEPTPASLPDAASQLMRHEPKSVGDDSMIDRPRSHISLTPTGDLLSAVESLARSSNADAIQTIIRSSARRLIGSDGVALILAEGDECHYVEEDAVGPLWKGRKFKMTECISGWSMINRKSAVIPDISLDERIPHHLYAETFVKSLVMTPVGAEHPLGALGAYWASTYQPTGYEIETVQILARATAAALENANAISALSHALAQAELRRDELGHRAENAYLTAQALAHASLPAGWAEMFSSRMASLLQVHETIDERLARQGEIDIRELIKAELETYAASLPNRLTLVGTSLLLERVQAIALGVAVHELAASAMIRDPMSGFDARWHVDGGLLVFEWREDRKRGSDSEGSNDRQRSQILSRLIEDQLGGRISQRLEDRQTVCRIEIPLKAATAPSEFIAP
jgi:two-component sensor histidine kinase